MNYDCCCQQELKGLATHPHRCCTAAAAVAPLTLQRKALKKKKNAVKHPRLKNALLGIRTPEYFPEESLVLDRFKQQFSCYEKCVELATHRTLVQLPSRIQGAMHPGSTLSFELAA